MEVKTIAVIGAGTMGRGIAYAAALGGYKTILEDVSGQGARIWRWLGSGSHLRTELRAARSKPMCAAGRFR
jgi:3-hydroxyacyl-CoA dehydrogenase